MLAAALAAAPEGTPTTEPETSPSVEQPSPEADETMVSSEPTEEDAAAPDEAIPEDEPPPSEQPPVDDEILHVAPGTAKGPPFYTKEDEAKLRTRHGVEVEAAEPTRQAKWRCLIADPTCGVSFEVNATSAYAYRMRQGDVREAGAIKWSSARVQYDFWLNLPVLFETSGDARYTRISIGPKGGVAFSDSGDLWGNLGLATRYWLGRGRWAPTIEFTSALTFRMGGRPTREQYDASGQLIEPQFRMMRGPAGFSADVGFGFGGFGAIIVGGQYDSPFAREDIPEIYRTPAAGMFFVGFRGNILWGGPAGAAVLTHVLAQRYAGPPT
jgi:hypothetical protein